MSPIISPRELAEAIGVSESSLKRWADEGLIQVSKTAGGHRRITIGEAIRFIRATKAPLVRPDALGMGDVSGGGNQLLLADDPDERLFALLHDGKAREARGLLLTLYLSGQSIAQVADGPIRIAMERLGGLWRHDQAGIFLEHRAVDICVQAVQQLRLMVEPSNPGPVAVGAGAPDDPYILPTLLAATALAAEGMRTVNLGPDTPIAALTAAVEKHDPLFVWLSVSSVHDARALEAGVHQLAECLGDRNKTLVLGGRSAESVRMPVAKHVRCVESISELVTIAGALRNPHAATHSES